MRIAAFQCDLAGASQLGRLAALRQAIEGAGAAPPAVMVCPELFMSGYNVGAAIRERAEAADGTFAQGVAHLARDTGVAIVYGYPERDGEQVFSAAACIGPDGALLGNHRKLRIPPGFEQDHLDPGEGSTIFDFAGLRFALLVCYDAEFPETVRHAARAGAQCVLVPTALSNRWDVVARRVMPARAFENGVYLVYCNHAGTEGDITFLGASCIVSPMGDDLTRAGVGAEIISATLDVEKVSAAQARLPYLRDLAALEQGLQAG